MKINISFPKPSSSSWVHKLQIYKLRENIIWKELLRKLTDFLHVHIKTYAQIEHKIHNKQQQFKAI